MIMQCDLNLKGKKISLFHMNVHFCLYIHVCMYAFVRCECVEVTDFFLGGGVVCMHYIEKTSKSIIFMSSNMVSH